MFDPLIQYSSRHRGIALLVAVVAAVAVMGTGELAHSLAETSLQSVRVRNGARYDALLLRSLLTDAETGQRGFLMTGREAYLEPLLSARPAMTQVVDRLRSQYDGSDWEVLVGMLDQRVHEKLSELDTTIALYKQGEHDKWQAIVDTDVGRKKMDAVRDVTRWLEAYEADHIATERANVYRALNFGRIGVHGLSVLALLGFVYFLRKNDAFNRARIEHAKSLQAERDRLDAEVQRRTEELTELARHLTTVREDERSHLARELHDELGSLLTAAKLDIARARRMSHGVSEGISERLVHMGALIDEGIVLKRRIIEDLRPSALSNLGLVPALEILTREFAERSGLVIHTELLGVATSVAGKLAIYRLVQEALTNVLRHAQAKQVWVAIQDAGAESVLRVRDDGQGFSPASVASGHHGLLGMRYRIEALGGELKINAAPGQGTEILARLPFAVRRA